VYRKDISGGIKAVILIVLVSSLMTLMIPEIYGQEVNSSSGVEFLEINVEPENILVGDSIIVYATVINNSDTPISFQSGCDSPIWLDFLSDNVELIAFPACQGHTTIQIEPGQSKPVKAPREGLVYKAISAGTLEAEVFFSYGRGEQTVPSTTISKTITLQINSEKEIPIVSEISSKSNVEKREIPPHKQVSSGTNPQDVICSEGLGLIFKSNDNSPACVKPSTAEKLIQRGWARS